MSERLTINQISAILQVKIKTLEFWEREFQEFMETPLSKSKDRTYSQQDLELLSQVKELLLTEQYTVKGAKRRLELERTLTSAMGVEHNLKATIFFMFSAIMEELQKSREESQKLADEVYRLRSSKEDVEIKLLEEQNKSLLEFVRDKLYVKKSEVS